MVRLWDESQGAVHWEPSTKIAAWVEGVFYRMPVLTEKHETLKHLNIEKSVATVFEKEKEKG